MHFNHTLIKHNTDSIVIEVPLSKDMIVFDGHFRTVAIMPAVAQIYIVEKMARKYLGLTGKFTSMRQLKFSGPICPRPNTSILINIIFNKSKQQIIFEIHENETLKSKGRLNYCDGLQQ